MNDKTIADWLREEAEYNHERLGSDMLNEAADTIGALQSRIEAMEAALRETMSRCADCGGRGSFVKHDEVTDRDLWESCAFCAVGYAALESQP